MDATQWVLDSATVIRIYKCAKQIQLSDRGYIKKVTVDTVKLGYIAILVTIWFTFALSVIC